jgi:CHAT domain-containing protein/tetratricopeptide (TPR) repeat protein
LALQSNPPDVAAVDGFRQVYLRLFSQPSSLGAAWGQSKAETSLDLHRACERTWQELSPGLDPAGRQQLGNALIKGEYYWYAFLRESGRLDEAIEVASMALSTWPGPNKVRPLFQAGLADLLRVRCRWTEAETLIATAEAEWADLGDEKALANPRRIVQSVRVRMLADLGLPDLAFVELERLKGLLDQSGDGLTGLSAARADYWLVRANLLISLGRDRAAQVVSELEAVVPPTDSPLRRTPEGLALLVRLGAARAQSEDAAEQDRGQGELIEALATPGLPAGEALIAEMELIRLALYRGELDEARQRIASAEQLIENGRGTGPITTQPIREAARLRLFAARLERQHSDSETGADGLEAAREAFALLLEQWRATPQRDGGVGFLHFSTRRENVSELISAEIANAPGPEGITKALEHLLKAQELGSLARQLGVTTPGIEEALDRLLAPQRSLLLFLPSGSLTHIFLADTQGLAHHVGSAPKVLLKALAPWKRAALRLEASPSESERTRLQAEAKDLWLDFLGPLGKRLEGSKELILIGQELLGDLPVEALPWDTQQTFSQRFALSQSPSLALLLALENRATAPRTGGLRAALLVASELTAEQQERWPGLATLPFDADDGAALTAPFRTPRARLLSGTEATLQGLKSLDLGQLDLLHLFAHGVLDLKRERPSGILLRADTAGPVAPQEKGSSTDSAPAEASAQTPPDTLGALWCEQIETLGALPPLVILSACSSAKAPDRLGDDTLANLGGELLLRGAQVVILTSHEVDYTSTVALMARLHEHLNQGLSPAAALQRAELDLAQDPKRPSFFRPGLFQVIGRGLAPLCQPER